MVIKGATVIEDRRVGVRAFTMLNRVVKQMPSDERIGMVMCVGEKKKKRCSLIGKLTM